MGEAHEKEVICIIRVTEEEKRDTKEALAKIFL